MRFLALLPFCGFAVAGPYPDDDHIAAETPTIWASTATIERGPVDATIPDGAVTTFGSTSDATGAVEDGFDPTLGVVSLGDGGMAIITFPFPVADGPGPDLAVFENGFSPAFLELAHVEVSSDGIHFVRFPSVSLTQTGSQIGPFENWAIDPTDLHNLAGKYEGGSGTPFDLADLRGTDPMLDVSHITHVRVIDVVGAVNPLLGSTDSLGNLINDPFPTNFITGGFDLDAIGAMHAAPLGTTDWTTYHFPSGGEDADGDDPDEDQIPNLVEFAIGTDPNGRSSPPLKISRSNLQITAKWNQSPQRSGATLHLQGSNDMNLWTNLVSAVNMDTPLTQQSGVTVSTSQDGRQVTATVTAAFQFYRLQANR